MQLTPGRIEKLRDVLRAVCFELIISSNVQDPSLHKHSLFRFFMADVPLHKPIICPVCEVSLW